MQPVPGDIVIGIDEELLANYQPAEKSNAVLIPLLPQELEIIERNSRGSAK